MKKFWFFALSLAVSVSLLGAPGVQAASKVIKIGQVVAKGHIENVVAEKFKQVVEAKTDLKVQVYPGGQLGKYSELFQEVKMGAVQMSTMPTSFLTPFYAPLRVLDLPFLFENYAHYKRFIQSSGGQEFLDRFLKGTGVRVLGVFHSGFQGFYDWKRPIRSIDDMKGLKMRVMKSPVLVDSMNAYGAQAVAMSLPEFYTAMQQKVVDGGENSIETYESQKHFEVAKYYTISDHKLLPEFLIINDTFFRSLTPEQQKVLLEAGKEASALGMEIYPQKEAKAKEKATAGGAQWYKLDPGARAAFVKALQPVYKKYGKAPGAAEVLKLIAELK
jgi:tripartite ATP-independent transporter DctP family solute receptor